jgi:hypothetical protein
MAIILCLTGGGAFHDHGSARDKAMMPPALGNRQVVGGGDPGTGVGHGAISLR